jgi:hypothetical protein
MANVLTAGNSSNGGTAISTDTSGTLNIVTGSGSGANAITIDASQAVTMPGTLAVTGAQTVGGNLTVTGTLTASGGVSGSITSGTAVSASGTSVNYTSIPAGVKRITVMFSGVSTSGTSNLQVQIGTSGGVQTSGYLGSGGYFVSGAASSIANFTTGFGWVNPANTAIYVGAIVLTLFDSATGLWVASGNLGRTDNQVNTSIGGNKTLSGTLDRVRITTVNGTDTFDAGSINILYE